MRQHLVAGQEAAPLSHAAQEAAGSTPSSLSEQVIALLKCGRSWWPGGGTARPRYASPGAAISSLPFSSAQRGLLTSRFAYNRPVYGFGV